MSTNTEKQTDYIFSLAEGFNKERELMHRQMMSSVSHDLKTPLVGIIGSLEIHDQMKDTLKPEKKQALLETALQEAYRLDTFITNILDMARLENGHVRAKLEYCDLGQLLQTCVIQMAPRLKGSHINIAPQSGVITAYTDPMLLLRCVGILLDNAIKHGGIPPVIDIEYGRGDFGQDYIRVRDNGFGIADSMMHSIFSKYTRFVKQDSQNAGTGLGLAICREIMRLLDGSVTVRNRNEGGAVFTLQFPVA